MRLLHTSDLHLGKLFYNVSLLDCQEHALKQIEMLLSERDVDGLVIAGDLYDRAIPPEGAVALLNAFLVKVCSDMGIPTYIIAGNHDSGERLGFASSLLKDKGLHLAGPVSTEIRPVNSKKGDESVDIFLVPYAHPRVVGHKLGIEAPSHQVALAALVESAKGNRTEGRPAVIIAHCFVTGGVVSDSERALSVGGSEEVSASLFRDFDYAALGHLHAPQYRDTETIRYSGSPLKYSFSEISHDKGVSIVDIDPDGTVAIEHVPLKPLRDVREITGTFDELMTAGETDPGADDFLRICLTDEHTIPGAMTQLQAIYPNALELEDIARREIERGEAIEIAPVENQAPLVAFKEFYESVSDKELSDDDQAYMADVVERAEEALEARQ